MNVVLFHMNYYDERQENYSERYLLFKKCYDSVLKEFKDDNILVFHNMEEIFEKYPQVKELYLSDRFSSFRKTKIFYLCTDLLRTLLTFVISDMLYLDSDIYVKSGFKQKICEFKSSNLNKNIFLSEGMYYFYSRHSSKSWDLFLSRFNEHYLWDAPEIEYSNIKFANDCFDTSCLNDNFIHYQGLFKTFENERLRVYSTTQKYEEYMLPYLINDFKESLIEFSNYFIFISACSDLTKYKKVVSLSDILTNYAVPSPVIYKEFILSFPLPLQPN